MYDALKLCTPKQKGMIAPEPQGLIDKLRERLAGKQPVSGKVYYEIDPAVAIPATIERIKECLLHPYPLPEEIVNMADADPYIAAKGVFEEVKNVPYVAWDLALLPKEAIDDKFKQDLRVQALAEAMSWFNRALSLQTGGKVHTHIIRNEQFKQ